jgi:hypothetical protein
VEYTFNFNDLPDSSSDYLYLDTLQLNNIWQIGTPDKTIFTSGYFGPNALVTDTLNPYPINNASSFEFSFIHCFDQICGCCAFWISFGIAHRIESDYGLDGGTIEVSHDNGENWMNLVEDTEHFYFSNDLYSINDTVTSLGKPGFSGSQGWDWLIIDFFAPEDMGSDTTRIRFTFQSDDVNTNKDGWMIGGIEAYTQMESLEEYRKDLISISPNPVDHSLHVHKQIDLGRSSVRLLDYTGQVVFESLDFKGNLIDTSQLHDGAYILRYSDAQCYTVKTFIVQH